MCKSLIEQGDKMKARIQALKSPDPVIRLIAQIEITQDKKPNLKSISRDVIDFVKLLTSVEVPSGKPIQTLAQDMYKQLDELGALSETRKDSHETDSIKGSWVNTEPGKEFSFVENEPIRETLQIALTLERVRQGCYVDIATKLLENFKAGKEQTPPVYPKADEVQRLNLALKELGYITPGNTKTKQDQRVLSGVIKQFETDLESGNFDTDVAAFNDVRQMDSDPHEAPKMG